MSSDFASLVTTKQTQVTGHNVNYYLVLIPKDSVTVETTVEVEDTIEIFEMTFAEGCVFKALVRLCKLRQDLGKPGSSSSYESQKSSYYGLRMAARIKTWIDQYATGWRRWFNPVVGVLLRWIGNNAIVKMGPTLFHVTIDKPKRLEPYHFYTDQFIKALGATAFEKTAFECIFSIAYDRKRHHVTKRTEQYVATLIDVTNFIESVSTVPTIVDTTNPNV
jgi:hypothetical protein